MNGPAYALMGLLFLVGVFMIVSAVRRRRQPGGWGSRERWLHVGVVVLWLGTLVLIPVAAEPGSQPKLGAVVQAVTLVLLVSAARDLRYGRRPDQR